MAQFVSGVMALVVGGVLLLMSIDVISYSSIEPMVYNLWPLLMMMVGFFILNGALKNPCFELLAGVCFIAFCVGGVLWFGVPGSLDNVVINLPFRDGLAITLDPWFWD